MPVSTLGAYVAALGGSIRLIVEFEGKPDIELGMPGIALEPKEQAAARKRAIRQRVTPADPTKRKSSLTPLDA